jgi:hypothetical protein
MTGNQTNQDGQSTNQHRRSNKQEWAVKLNSACSQTNQDWHSNQPGQMNKLTTTDNQTDQSQVEDSKFP